MDVGLVLTAVGKLVHGAWALKAAITVADASNIDARHLFECLRDNTLLVAAALYEGLGGTNPMLDAALGNTINRMAGSLHDARNAAYKVLYAGR
jgi:hypothetical protein